MSGTQRQHSADTIPIAALTASRPRPDVLPAIAQLVAASKRKVVVLDDDTMGTQTVHGIDVLTEWSEASLAAALADPRPCFFVLTNSRSLPEADATALACALAANLRAAARQAKVEYTVISRSDSTLRGHFAAEIDALAESESVPYDGVLVIPAFFEGGRITVNDVHYLREGDHFVPVATTEFAGDATFGYRSSNLCAWIEEKTRGRVSAASVASIPIELLRESDGAQKVRDRLLAFPRGSYVVVNAASYTDLEVFVYGVLLAEAAGRRFLCRTAASYVRVRAGLDAKPLLDAAALRDEHGDGGLIVVGSYTGKTTGQLALALKRPRTVSFEMDVSRLAQPGGEEAEIARLVPLVDAALREQRTVIVFTTRARVTAVGLAGHLDAGKIVSNALVKFVASVGVRPRFLITKGGITSSEIAVSALGVRRALIMGQAETGIPVWKTGEESRWPGLAQIVFPGNIGNDSTLVTLMDKLGG